MKKNNKIKKIMVNSITATRLLGSLIMVPLYIMCGGLTTAIAAGAIFTTDCLDGFLARKLHVQSFFGSFLDTICDKLLGISILLILSSINPIFLISICLELGIFTVNTISIQKGNNVKTSILGKIKTNILDISLVCGLLGLSFNELRNMSLFLNNKLLTSLSSIPTCEFLKYLSIPVIISQSIVLGDYIYKAYKQDQERLKENKIKIKEVEENIQVVESEKENLPKEKIRLKNNEEIINDLFDTEYYLEHKSDSIKKLFFTIDK